MAKTLIESEEVQLFEKGHIEAVRALSAECMVLLKNNGILPLEGAGPVALYGSGARKTIKGGTGSGDVNVRHFVTVEEGLENAGFQIVSKSWLDAYDALIAEEKDKFFKGVRKEADAAGVNPFFYALGKTLSEPEYQISLEGDCDTAIYVLARNSGEGDDRKPKGGDINLTETEIRDILELNRKYKQFLLILNTGGMVNLEPVEEVETILLMGQLGSATGDALADVLLGKSFPSGKLTMSWAPIEKYPSTEGFADPNNTDYKEGVYVGYRYFDTIGYKPVYPFGYGLGYTDFEIKNVCVTADESTTTISAEVYNVGSRPGKEVVQVYYSAPSVKLDKPYQELAGFTKTKELAPGEMETVTISYPTEYMASYDAKQAAYVLEEGQYLIRVGNSSAKTEVVAILVLDQDAVIEKTQNISGDCGFEDWKPEVCLEEQTIENKESIPVISLNAANFECRTISYQEDPKEIPSTGRYTWSQVVQGEVTLDTFVGGLTEDELIYLCIGAYNDSEDMMEVIGNASSSVAGAAGETTGRLSELGVPTLVMADGPAGLRLSPKYKQLGEIAKAVSSNMVADFMSVFTAEELQAMASGAPAETEEEKNAPICYQYCVAIPIGTDLAQTWNKTIAEKCGEIVGKEMELFGVHIWLAPAMNIHRSPMCGRNFEYYSEDPLLSGIIAAEITKGVQAHKGCSTTIKHYACNNQETNRYFSNSNVSERALREIYLKGFEICVKDAQPDFLMTSYNLINGEHACNRKDIQTYALRDEWGFKGTVMTDWLVTGGMGAKGEVWPCASAAGNVKAGNDLTMPGLPSDRKDMLDALNNSEHPYALTKAELQLCAKRTLEMILKLS